MLNEQQIRRMLEKQYKFYERMESRLFDVVDTVRVRACETYDKLDAPPCDGAYTRELSAGDTWGDNKKYCWFKTEYTVPEHLNGQDLYFRPEYNGYEALLFVNGVPHTNFASKIVVSSHGNHYCKMFRQNAAAGETIELDLEAYAGHNIAGTQPYETPTNFRFPIAVGNFEICVRNELYTEFYYDYRAIFELYQALGRNDLKGAQIEGCLLRLHEVLYCADAEVTDEELRACITEAIAVMAPFFEKDNTDTSRGMVGVLGHSHMDTAWLWEIDETIKKCARTFANQLSLMDRYPEYHFIQSSSYHLKMMETHYPALFEKIAQKIRAGRYEPNGGSWIECDCNITGGEFLIRQFLWGQNYTKKHFGYLSNAFYLPDTFGYSASIPQILKGVGIDYFLTTKLTWNDTNKFPYDTYYWEGIDGSRVFVHHNHMHCWPSPKTAIEVLRGLSQKSVSNQRLITYGHGDGGGGPEDGMPEMARRMKKLEGCPQVVDTTVGDFMVQLEKTALRPNTYRGELYLELHRGTLTGQHTIKRNNRKAEIAIRNAEYLTVADAVAKGVEASAARLAPHVETLLVNQFHDILPGTSIPEVNDRSIRETTQLLKDVQDITEELLSGPGEDKITLTNTLSFGRQDVLRIQTDKYLDADCRQQLVALPDGSTQLHVSGIHLDGLESRSFSLTQRHDPKPSPFRFENQILHTPFAKVTFDEAGTIASFVDLKANRELRGNGLPLNSFLFGEDLPNSWDTWDVDADVESKLLPCRNLEHFAVVADGETEFRIRTTYRLSAKSILRQDMVFYADSPRVDFETVVDWNDPHRLLKAAFDVSVRSDFATQEIQYGNLKRSTKRNTTVEQAAFEVCNHKYTDLSEPNYGVAILNDCKYAIGVNGSNMTLTLHKGGAKPDPRGDAGVHSFTYAFLPHSGGFSHENAIAGGYELNYPVLSAVGGKTYDMLFTVDHANIIAEAVKPCEEPQRAFIVRLYEAEGTYTNAKLTPCAAVTGMTLCDMLENEQEITDGILQFRPFEIKTIKMTY